MDNSELWPEFVSGYMLAFCLDGALHTERFQDPQEMLDRIRALFDEQGDKVQVAAGSGYWLHPCYSQGTLRGPYHTMQLFPSKEEPDRNPAFSVTGFMQQ